MHTYLPHFFITGLLAFGGANSVAQQQVYRCESGGKVTYTHEPCLNAQAVDTMATQGLNSMTGQRKPSADVRRSENQRTYAEALYPLTRMSPQTYSREVRRYKLLPEDRLQCNALDIRLPGLEASARNASATEKAQSDRSLLEARKRYYELRC